MSISLDVRKRVADGSPVLFWDNRIEPFIVGSQSVAHSGKVCIVREVVASEIGKPMRVRFILAKKAHLDSWKVLVSSDPFNTTSLASYFSTGHTVIFDQNNPIEQANMLIRQYDLDQTIFVSGGAAYRAGFDYFMGTLNLIIIT